MGKAEVGNEKDLFLFSFYIFLLCYYFVFCGDVLVNFVVM